MRGISLGWVLISAMVATAAPSQVTPEEAKFNAAVLARIDAVVADGIRDGHMPGCVVCVGRRGKIGLLKSYGERAVEPTREAMTTDTIFDLASLTKPIATGTSVLLLVEQGKVKVDAPVAIYLPEFAANGKEKVTVEQLLIHTSGLIPDNALRDYEDGPARAIERVFALQPRTPPGEAFAYSDVGFIVLAELVKQVSGQDVQAFSQEHVFRPLGMKDTRYLPPEDQRPRIAPTERRGETWIRGEVHDPRALKLGGIAGHAGLFSTAADLATYASAMLDQGRPILREDTWKTFTAPRKIPARDKEAFRTLGWDSRSGYSGNRGEGMSAAAFGHGGFTGTGIWIDPDRDLFVIVLANRLHPDGKGNVNPLIGRIGTIAVEAGK